MLSSQRLCPSSCRSFVAFIPHLGFMTIRRTLPKKRNKRTVSPPTVASDSEHYGYIIQLLLQPQPTPSFSAKTCSLPGRHQMPPNLPRHPVSDKRKAFTGMAYGKVVRAKGRIVLLVRPLHRLADLSRTV